MPPPGAAPLLGLLGELVAGPLIAPDADALSDDPIDRISEWIGRL
jgi:hypothetical protein